VVDESSHGGEGAPRRAGDGYRPADPDAALVAAAREEPRAFLALYDRYSTSRFPTRRPATNRTQKSGWPTNERRNSA